MPFTLGLKRHDPTFSAMTRTLGILIFPDFQLIDAAGPIAAFEIANRWEKGRYDIRLMALKAGQIKSSSGVRLMAEKLLDPAKLDTLIVAGGPGVDTMHTDAKIISYVLKASRRVRRVVSICSGAYILAAAKLLDRRRATTHWHRSVDFTKRFPDVQLEPDRIFIKEGKIWTSAGCTAGIDLALALIADDLGEAAARKAAQRLVVYHRRPGGQSQFSALLDMQHADGRFSGLLTWAKERLSEPLTVEQLAEAARMSPRQFARAFTAETGVTPAKAVERLRLEVARERIEADVESLDQIALMTGFNDPERMRRAFLRNFGEPPQGIRRKAKKTAAL